MRMSVAVLGLAALSAAACRPSDVLSVPAPTGVISSSALQNRAGAEGAFSAAKGQLFAAADGFYYKGLLASSGLLTDEFAFSGFSATYHAVYANIDARVTAGGGGFAEQGDIPWQYLLQARSSLLLATPGLAQYEPASGRSAVGEAYALAGYTELLLAEAYCAGTPLDKTLPGGSIRYGSPLTTDSLLGVAEGHFDSALAAASGNATVTGLASVGLGRVLLDRGRYAAAAAAVTSVPTSFAYDVELEPNSGIGATQFPTLYAAAIQFRSYRLFNVADREGGNGLNFASAQDPRLGLDTTTYQTSDGTPWRLPTKFETSPSLVPLATGIEARLIEAEAALQANQTVTWAGDLNALRADSADTKVVFQSLLTPDSTTTASAAEQVDVMFRERAFWLFGTGTRLGDLRRLIRQYGRDQSTVFPSGPYVNGSDSHLPAPIPNYGTDVNLTLPTSYGLSSNGISETNPNYKGCIASTKTA